MKYTEVVAHLMLAGHPDLADWARAHGHNPNNVRQILHRYLADPHPRPATAARAILAQLGRTIGQPVIAYDAYDLSRWQQAAHLAALQPLMQRLVRVSALTTYPRRPKAIWGALARRFGGSHKSQLPNLATLDEQRAWLQGEIAHAEAAVQNHPEIADLQAQIAALKATLAERIADH